PGVRSSRESAGTAGSTSTRCRRAGRSSSASASSSSRRRGRTSFLAQLIEDGPARVGALLHVLVRLDIEVLATDGTEAGAIGPAEDLVRQRKGDRVVRPRREVDSVVREVLRPLVVALRLRRLVLAQPELERQLSVLQATEAGALERDVERELEDGAARGTCHRELGRRGIRLRLVALAPEQKRLDFDLDVLASLVAGTDSQGAEVERGHAATVARQAQPPWPMMSPATARACSFVNVPSTCPLSAVSGPLIQVRILLPRSP